MVKLSLQLPLGFQFQHIHSRVKQLEYIPIGGNIIQLNQSIKIYIMSPSSTLIHGFLLIILGRPSAGRDLRLRL